MKKKTVAFVINDFTLAGAQRLHTDLFKALGGRFDMHLVTLFQFPHKKELYAEVPPAVEVHRLDFGGFRDVREWWRLAKTLRRIKPDVVVSSLFFGNTAARILKILVGYRCIAIEHNTYTKKTRPQILVDRALAHLTQRIVAVSETVRSFTAAQEGIPLSKFTVIQNGIDLERIKAEAEKADVPALRRALGFGEAEKIVLNVGRLTAQKNQAALIEGFARWGAAHPEYRLVIVGEGTLKEAFERRIRELRVEGGILLAGAREDVVSFYRMSEFFISPSHIEGFGIAHAEALACGTPVLTTRTAGPDEMIREGQNGFFLPDGSVESIIEGLEKMARADRARMSQNASRSVSGYDIKKTAAAYAALIDSCL